MALIETKDLWKTYVMGSEEIHAFDAPAQLRGRRAARQHVAQAAIKWKVEHARHLRRRAHVALDLARLRVGKRLVDGEAFAEDEEVAPPRLPRHGQDAGRAPVLRVQ